jgi:hypothetical protein
MQLLVTGTAFTFLGNSSSSCCFVAEVDIVDVEVHVEVAESVDPPTSPLVG